MKVISEETWMNAARRGFKKSKRGQPDADAVNDQRSDKVLHDRAMAASGDRQSFDKLREIIANENHVCAFSCNIRTSTHRYSDSSLHESGSVIDSVTYHNDLVTRSGESANESKLVLRQEFGGNFVHAQFSSDVVSHGLRIPGEKNCLQSHRFEIVYRLRCFGPKHIGNDDSSEELAFSCHKNLRIRLRDCARGSAIRCPSRKSRLPTMISVPRRAATIPFPGV